MGDKGNAIFGAMNSLEQIAGTTANVVGNYQNVQAQAIVTNRRAEYIRQKNRITAEIQGDPTLSPEQWLDKWNEASVDLNDAYTTEDNPIARKALQQMISDGNESVRSQFENTKAQWYKGQAKVTVMNGIEESIAAGDWEQLSGNLMLYRNMADSPEQFDQVKTQAANSYLMTTGFSQLNNEMLTNGKQAADAMLANSDYTVIMFDGEKKTLTPTLRGQLQGQLNDAWATHTKENDAALGTKASEMLVNSGNSVESVNKYLSSVGSMKFYDADEQYKWWSRGLSLLEKVQSGDVIGIGSSKMDENEALGMLAMSVNSMNDRAQYNDTVAELVANGSLTGSKVNTAFGYWDKKDEALNTVLDQIKVLSAKDKNGKQAMSDKTAAGIAGLVSQYRNTPGNEGKSSDELMKFVNALTSKELAKSLFKPSKLPEQFKPKEVDALESAISLFQGGYIGWMQETGTFDTWREAVGLPKTATYEVLEETIKTRAAELMKTDYKRMNGKIAEGAAPTVRIDKGNGLPTVTMTREGDITRPDGSVHKGQKSEDFVLKIMTAEDYAVSSNERARIKYKAAVGEETWFKVGRNNKGETTYTYWAPAGTHEGVYKE